MSTVLPSVYVHRVHAQDIFAKQQTCMNSFQTTLTPNPEKSYRYYSVMKQQ